MIYTIIHPNEIIDLLAPYEYLGATVKTHLGMTDEPDILSDPRQTKTKTNATNLHDAPHSETIPHI